MMTTALDGDAGHVIAMAWSPNDGRLGSGRQNEVRLWQAAQPVAGNAVPAGPPDRQVTLRGGPAKCRFPGLPH